MSAPPWRRWTRGWHSQGSARGSTRWYTCGSTDAAPPRTTRLRSTFGPPLGSPPLPPFAHTYAKAVGTLLVWGFVSLHHAALIALIPLDTPTSAPSMALRVLAHVGGLSLACGVAGHPRWTLTAAALPASVLAYTALGACTQTGVTLVAVQGTVWLPLFCGSPH